MRGANGIFMLYANTASVLSTATEYIRLVDAIRAGGFRNGPDAYYSCGCIILEWSVTAVAELLAGAGPGAGRIQIHFPVG